MAADHSKTPPSSAHRWINCPGSVKLEAEAPDESGPEALVGSAVHFINELRSLNLISAVQLSHLKGQKVSALGSFYAVPEYFQEVVITEEMIDCAQQWDIFVRSQLPPGVNTFNRDFVRIEEHLTTDIEGLEGTTDLVIVNPFVELHVADYKHGIKQVDVGPQLAAYMLGALKTFGTDFETLKMTIFQPRGGGPTVKTLETSVKKFYGTWIKKFSKAMAEIREKPDLKRQGEWCQYCKGVTKCDRVVRKTSTIRRDIEKEVPIPNDAKKLIKLLSYEAGILQYLKDAKKAVNKLLRAGTPVKGFKLVEAMTNRKWVDEEKAACILYEYLAPELLSSDPRLRSPAQVEELFRKQGVTLPEDFHKLFARESKGAIMVREADKRPEYKPTTVEEAFDDGEKNAN